MEKLAQNVLVVAYSSETTSIEGTIINAIIFK